MTENLKNSLKQNNINKVGYVFSEKLLELSSKNPIIKNRQKLVHSLIKSYGLLESLNIITPKPAGYKELRCFHSEDYCNSLKEFSGSCESSSDKEDEYSQNELSINEDLSEYGLGFDCPVWYGLYDFCQYVAGSTLTACNEIINGSKIVVNWFGGWHHAQRGQAAGYCYINDIVLGILKLREHFEKVLYIDLDVHYGDGVADAFESTKKVFTVSFHQYEPGFYPGCGSVEETGFGSAKGYSVNFPYKSGFSGKLFLNYSIRLIDKIFEKYQPNVVVIQCGADSITGDPLSNTNLIPEDMVTSIKSILRYKIPTLLLGGGGYNLPNTSRYWTYLTASLCGIDLPNDIPDEDDYFLEYSLGYELKIEKKNIKDLNTEEYLNSIIKQIEEHLNN